MKHNYYSYFLLIIISVFFTQKTSAQALQFQFSNYTEPIVLALNGDTLTHAWTGGTLASQFGEIDLDGDGMEDLVVFQKYDSLLIPFLRKFINGKIVERYAPEYIQAFPMIRDWFVLIDWDGDGKKDLFTAGNGVVMLYKNTYTNRLSFTLITHQIDFQNGPSKANIYVSSAESAIVSDIDNDGDIDILAFDLLFPRILFYKNMSMEKYGRRDSLDYVIGAYCWGKFEREFNCNGFLSGLSDNCVKMWSPKTQISKVKHSGGTLTIFDRNKDGKKDLLTGTLGCSNIMYFENKKTANRPDSLTAPFDTLFPFYNVPIQLPDLPLANIVDIDMDGKKDMVVTVFEKNNSVTENNIWYYKNTSSNNLDSFTLQTKSYLQNKMIDHAYWSAPVMLDLSGDGIKDLLVLSHNANAKAQGYYYKNIGTTNSPSFKLVDTNYMNLSQYNKYGMVPATADLDADGDNDLILGDADGQLMYFTNTALSGQAASFSLVSSTYLGFNCGYNSAPELVDLDRDGLVDLLVGTGRGTINFYKNTGTANVPNFTFVRDTLGGLVLNDIYQANACPRVADLNKDGKLDLIIGDLGGYVYFYNDIENTWNGIASGNSYAFYFPITQSIGIGDFGQEAKPWIHDLNGDSIPDLMVGTFGGGIRLFENTVSTLGVKDNIYQSSQMKVYPNPANDYFALDLGQNIFGNALISLTDISGRTVLSKNLDVLNGKANINVSSLQSGTYFVKLAVKDGKTFHSKLVIYKN